MRSAVGNSSPSPHSQAGPNAHHPPLTGIWSPPGFPVQLRGASRSLSRSPHTGPRERSRQSHPCSIRPHRTKRRAADPDQRAGPSMTSTVSRTPRHATTEAGASSHSGFQPGDRPQPPAAGNDIPHSRAPGNNCDQKTGPGLGLRVPACRVAEFLADADAGRGTVTTCGSCLHFAAARTSRGICREFAAG